MQTDSIHTTWRVSGDKVANCDLGLHRYGRADRTRRGILGGLLFVALAAVSVLLPGFHFVLVPGFLLGAVPFGLIRSRKTVALVSATGDCPKCGHRAVIDLGGERPQPTLAVFCPGCFDRLSIDVPQSARR